MNRHYERRLPHWDVVGRPLFVTFRLHGSLPRNRVFPPGKLSSGQAFVAVDRILDAARSGPVFLRRPEVARLIVKALWDGQVLFGRYELHAFVVMSNHVHMLATSRVPASQWLRARERGPSGRTKAMTGLCAMRRSSSAFGTISNGTLSRRD